MSNCLIDAQPIKADAFMLCNVLGKSMLANDEQPEKALLSITVTVLGKFIDLSS
jgi:hypothetical protein